MASVLGSSPSRSKATGPTRGAWAPTASSNPDSNVTRGALSGTMGASPYCVLATTPELPLSSNSACQPTAETSRLPGTHGQAGLVLRRMNSLNSTSMARTVSGSALPGSSGASATSSRRAGSAFARVGLFLLALQLAIVGLYITRFYLSHHATAATIPPTLPADPASTEYIIMKLAAESRRAAAAGGMANRHPQQQQQSGVVPTHLGRKQPAAAQRSALKAQPVHLAPAVTAATAPPLAQSTIAAKKDATATAIAGIAITKAATAVTTTPASKSAAVSSFAQPVVAYAGRMPNPPPIVGVVFYGRRDRVRILDCYLQRNLARNGGLLTSVVFVSATWQPADVTFLDRLVEQRQPEYRKIIPPRLDKGYTGHYAWMDPGTVYVKIDDDVVFIADDAIDHMLAAHMLHRYHLISANVVNHQPLELPHSQSGAHTLYHQTRLGDKSSWQPVMRQTATTSASAAGKDTAVAATAAAGASAAPMEAVPFIDNGWDTWGDWRRAASVHYSFLANQAAGRLGVYEFPHGEELWDFNKHFGYTRWRINMIMFQGAAIDVHVYNMSSTTGTYPGDDEDFITRILPQQLNRTSAAVSKALAVHFSFFKQREGLENSTDLLDRYALLAEKTCGRLVPAQ
ncbi:hypothetical protein Agub_g6510 [Astrephomene gubernaculifera]|uniref:Uncharacterized protein n=1 Tax=Astrephomene gubernaculifera TaxID=47775 RepID=A0AAD3DNJ4_9CHLO|nr:hypothetical protein Agub_g6510 [Astrephomene gubernaculifera]